MSKAKIVVYERDEERVRELKTVLGFLDYEAIVLEDWQQWQTDSVADEKIQAVILGLSSEDKAYRPAIETFRDGDNRLPIILLQDHAPENPAAALVGGGGEVGVISYISHPVKYPVLMAALRQAESLSQRSKALKRPAIQEGMRQLVGKSSAMEKIRRLIQHVAHSDATVLILGESGTGKEVVSRTIHLLSNRRGKPFVPINCGAIPGDLLESELFGHEKGAFTGAITSRQGRFEMAEGGTLLLDEIGDMSLPMQVKLLRVLQEKTFERVGSNKSIVSDVRVIAATHRNLEQSIRDGKFREDLFYRLNVFPIEMPPLRQRVDDIPLLIENFVHRLQQEGRGVIRLTQQAIESLQNYSWPGNVRELSNLIERLIILYPDEAVDVNDLPEKFRFQKSHATAVSSATAIPSPTEATLFEEASLTETIEESENLEADFSSNASAAISFETPQLPPEGIDLKMHMTTLEITLIKQALDEAGGVVAHAAKLLGMRRTTLVEKLRKYGLHRGEELI